MRSGSRLLPPDGMSSKCPTAAMDEIVLIFLPPALSGVFLRPGYTRSKDDIVDN